MPYGVETTGGLYIKTLVSFRIYFISMLILREILFSKEESVASFKQRASFNLNSVNILFILQFFRLEYVCYLYLFASLSEHPQFQINTFNLGFETKCQE